VVHSYLDGIKAFGHERITIPMGRRAGSPCIRRLPTKIDTFLNLLASGSSREQILEAYLQLEPVDIEASLTYTARFAPQGPGASGTAS